MKLSAIVITYNEEENIRECLESLIFADEIIVIDSNSTDLTYDKATEYTDNVITIEEEMTYGEKRNLGIEKAQGEWILWIDADERVPQKLRQEIQETIMDPESHDAYYINRKSFFITKFIKYCGWYPDYTLRLFKRSTNIRFNDALVHERALYEGDTKKLNNPLLHYTDRTFEKYFEKMNNYTTLSARELFNKGKKAGFSDIILRPYFTFLKMYILKLGFLDGFMGLVLCTLSSVHVMVKYLKLYALRQKPPEKFTLIED
jgi:glycosyltransferase involved in cell wall biosynthesis